MKILAIDTSTSIAGVAVLENENVIAELNLNNEKKTHSQKLIPLVTSVLKEFDLKIRDFEVFAVTIGPGSFTGLRIGIATVKTFAYTFSRPIIGLTTMDILANNFPYTNSLVCPIIDARNNQVYTALYENKEDNQIRISNFEGIHIDELVSKLNKLNQEVIFVGDGIKNNKDLIKSKLEVKYHFALGHLNYQRSSSLGILAYKKFLEKSYENCYDVKPFYLRKSQAERIRDEKKKS